MNDRKKHESIGQSIRDLDTPALLLDLTASHRNIRRMASFFADKPARLRPHFKNHKCTRLARLQLDAGSAIGMTCAKVGEAEVLVDHGFDDILIANQVVGLRKVQRLIEVARRAKVSVAVDDLVQAQAISQAAVAAGATVGLLVEVDIGMGRCGVAPGGETWELTQQIVELPGTEFRGLQAYEGHLVSIDDIDERTEQAREAMRRAVNTRKLIEERGIPVHAISGVSTSTHDITGVMDGVNEVQAGSYPTMDWRYHELVPQFEIAMAIRASVISKRCGEAVLDVGAKGVGSEFGPPKIDAVPHAEIPSIGSEEHCVVKNAPDWRVGETVSLIPSHSCTTCNLYREFHVHEDGLVIDVWPIEASGRLT